MKKSIKLFAVILAFSATSLVAEAQDAITISTGNFVRGTVQGTNFSSVIFKKEDESMVQYEAKDIKEFLWNGETYVSKPIVIKKKMEHRFFRIVEQGAVNLYSIGGNTIAEQPKQKKVRVRPSIGIGTGTGGFGGMGVGGGISFGGGGGRSEEQGSRVIPTSYFLEKYGTGPMQEIPVESGNSEGRTQQIKNILLQKLTNDEDLEQRINATESFDAKLIRSFVAAYNSMKK